MIFQMKIKYYLLKYIQNSIKIKIKKTKKHFYKNKFLFFLI